jgi:hypothetical protein
MTVMTTGCIAQARIMLYQAPAKTQTNLTQRATNKTPKTVQRHIPAKCPTEQAFFPMHTSNVTPKHNH